MLKTYVMLIYIYAIVRSPIRKVYNLFASNTYNYVNGVEKYMSY